MINAEEYFLRIAQTVSEQSTCLDKAVGCVITSADNQIVSCGYNGAPSKVTDCRTLCKCRKTYGQNCLATHAEINALIKAGERAKGGKLFVTLEPCFECAKAIINAGIKQVFYSKRNNKNMVYKMDVKSILEYVGITYIYLPLEEKDNGDNSVCDN